MFVDFGMKQRPIYSSELKKIGVAFIMNTTIGSWMHYIAEIEYFIDPIESLDSKLFTDLIKQAQKIYKEDFNNRISDKSNLSLALPVLDESEAEKQFQEFCEQ